MDIPLPPLPDWDSGFERREIGSSGLPYFEFTEELELPPSDPRKYRLIRLPNNLTAVCVHDADAKQAAASLSVNIGSLANPPELRGMAHFCEHLLFMGTEKYPKENAYARYLAEHSGYSNAYTNLSNTCYYFDIAADALEGALDRTDRELRAVDAEFKGYLQDDNWRVLQLKKSLSNPKHPYHMFDVGNMSTLKGDAERLGVDLRDELIKFHAKYYSSDIMKLVVVGSDSLDRLTEWTVQMFSPITSKGNTMPVFLGHPLSPSELGTVVRFKTANEYHWVDINFPMPNLHAWYREMPHVHIKSLLKHDGHGSVLAYLKKRGWATYIYAGASSQLRNQPNILSVLVTATDSGMRHYKDIVRVVFAYLQMLRRAGPQEWYHEERRRIRDIQFRFAEKGVGKMLAYDLSLVMHDKYIAPEHIVSNYALLRNYDETLLSRMLGLLNPDNCRILLGCKQFDMEMTEREGIFGVEYRIDPIPEDLARGIRSELFIDELRMPDPNIFIPENLDIKATVQTNALEAEPVLLRRDKNVEVWFKPDNRFFLPRGNISMFIEIPAMLQSPLTSNMADLFVYMLKSTMAHDVYNALLAGMTYRFYSTFDGLIISVTGINDKLHLLLETILRAAKTFTVDPTLFSVYMRQLRQDYKNKRNMDPSEHAVDDIVRLNISPRWHYEVLLRELDRITGERLQMFADTLFDTTRIKMLLTGNFCERDALAAIDSTVEILGTAPLPEYMRVQELVHRFDPGRYLHQFEMPDTSTLNSAVSMQIYAGPVCDQRERSIITLLVHIMREPLFDRLRTKEQLGYSIRGQYTAYLRKGHHGIRFTVRGECNPAYMTLRISEFLRFYRKYLCTMAEETFAGHVSSRIALYKEKLHNLGQEVARYWQHITSEYYEFDRVDNEIREMQRITKDDMVRFWDTYFNQDTAPQFTQITSQVWSARIPRPTRQELETFPSTTISLLGCLYREGVTRLSLGNVQEFVELQASADPNIAAVLQQLQALFLKTVADDDSAMHGDDIAAVSRKLTAQNLYVGTALRMAIDECVQRSEERLSNGVPISGPGDGDGCETSLQNIGMFKTADRVWVIVDPLAFKSTQRLCGAPIPTRKLVPKYA
ncbi:LuxS/MPP-like metallohydrolase [Linderina pennispora]|uniref:LuxS/MPP-like metallohydrolase n=1 Tax=Linderina pennispora TaxID=61395 RepID=A0A1Y1WFX1_9FUNG|nr:LuxS/MPP-like metallohydrolase [Linderina pennispora]ORX72295.1 LuxS/MPP-like metallohydrolase [Linderina pennispora]